MARRPKVLIVSEGFGYDTKIVHDDGEGTPIPFVTGADIRIRTNEVVTVELDLHIPTLSVKADVSEIRFACPLCGKVMEHKCDD